MHQLGFVLFTYLGAVLHAGAGSSVFAGLGMQPHYLFLVMITAVLYFEHWTALLWAAAAGLLSDGLSIGPLGVEMACFTAAAFVMQLQLGRHKTPGLSRITFLCLAAGLATLTLSNTIQLLITSQQFDHAKLVILITTTATITAMIVGGFRLVQTIFRKLVFRTHRRQEAVGY